MFHGTSLSLSLSSPSPLLLPDLVNLVNNVPNLVPIWSPHVHVDREAFSAKFWINPVALAYNLGYSAKGAPRGTSPEGDVVYLVL